MTGKVPLVGIVMGSRSDLEVMAEAAAALEELRVPWEMTVVSAHRSPHRAVAYAEGAAGRGLRVIIAGAGGAAHLAGVLAALTTLPVVGVPIRSANSVEGLDSILSMLQMPPGVPVATVALNGARNAGILAAQILATADRALARRVAGQRASLAAGVEKAAAELQAKGHRAVLGELGKGTLKR